VKESGDFAEDMHENIQFDVTEEYIKDVWYVYIRAIYLRAHKRHRLRDFLRDG